MLGGNIGRWCDGRAIKFRPGQGTLVDPFSRVITYLRVSVTDRCVYCMAEDMHFLPRKDFLSTEELDRIAMEAIVTI